MLKFLMSLGRGVIIMVSCVLSIIICVGIGLFISGLFLSGDLMTGVGFLIGSIIFGSILFAIIDLN